MKRHRQGTVDPVWIDLYGVQRTLIDIGAQYGIPLEALRYRLSKGWTPERAVETPIRGIDPIGVKPGQSEARRKRFQWGEAASSAKLTDDQRREVYRRYHDGEATQTVLGREYGVSQAAICAIVRNARWAPVRVRVA